MTPCTLASAVTLHTYKIIISLKEVMIKIYNETIDYSIVRIS